jgi:hypothetical protein
MNGLPVEMSWVRSMQPEAALATSTSVSVLSDLVEEMDNVILSFLLCSVGVFGL